MSFTASSDFSVKFSVSMGPIHEDGHRNVTIHGLHIQLPEPVPHTPPSRAPKVAPSAPLKKRPTVVEEKNEIVYEYEEAPLKYSWAHPVDTTEKQQDVWYRLLWKSVFAEYPFSTKENFTQFKIEAFYQSEFYTLRNTKYAHCDIQELMVLYMECVGWKTYYTTRMPEEVTRRLLLLETFFLPHKIRWNPIYYTAYCEWTANHGRNDVPRFDSLNRYQRMTAFFQLFLDKLSYRH